MPICLAIKKLLDPYNIDEKNQAIKLLLATAVASLGLYLNL